MRFNAKLINPEPITIEPLDKAATAQDQRRKRTSPRVAYGNAITLSAQLDFAQHRSTNAGPAHIPHTKTTAVAFVRVVDCVASSYTPAKGDRVTFNDSLAVTHTTTLAWVDEAELTGKTRRGFSLWKLRLTDRSPERDATV